MLYPVQHRRRQLEHRNIRALAGVDRMSDLDGVWQPAQSSFRWSRNAGQSFDAATATWALMIAFRFRLGAGSAGHHYALAAQGCHASVMVILKRLSDGIRVGFDFRSSVCLVMFPDEVAEDM
jgi:hypothetical protein